MIIVSTKKIKILSYFKKYLQHGFYPYFKELNDIKLFNMTLEQNLHTTVESDLVAIYPHLTGNSIRKIKQLLGLIANLVPFTPNWEALRKQLEIGDTRTLKTYFKYLEDARLIRGISKASVKLKKIELPDKIYLSNPNQLSALSSEKPNLGTVRESYFLTMLSKDHTVELANHGGFLIDQSLTFEIGGRKKSFHQVKTADHPYLASDDIEIGTGRKIPLWIFGFLY